MKISLYVLTLICAQPCLIPAHAGISATHQRPSGGGEGPPEVFANVSVALSGTSTVDIYCAAEKKKWPGPPRATGSIRVDVKKGPPIIAGDGAPNEANRWIQNPKPLPQHPTIVTYTCTNGRNLPSGKYGFAWNAKWSPEHPPCWSTPPFQPSVSGGVVVWNPDGMGGTIYIPKIETTAVPAKSNPNTWRKKIGVGEHVGCALVYAPGGCTVEWSVAGAGCTIVPSGYNAELIAGDSETPAVVTAAFTKEAPSIAETELVTLNVVPPTGVTARKLAEGMANIPAEDAEDIHEIVVKGGVDIAAAGAYMRLKWHFLPDDVSFYRVKWREMFAPAQNPHGCYLLSPHGHPEGMIWNGIQTDNDQTTVDHVYEWKAASTSGPPWIWFGMNGGMMELGGEIEWNISWRWIVIDKADEHAMGPNLEHVSVTGDGTMTIEKLGQPATEPAHIYNSQP